jgi:dynein heavy chain
MSGETWHWSSPLVFGELPDPRWKHTTTLWDKTKLVVFGGNASSTCRFNDTWVFNSVTMTWSRLLPPGCTFDADGNHIVNPGSDPATPCPRGSHAACVVGDGLYVFGGFGGIGFSRKDLNDLHLLQLDDPKWTKVLGKGKAPEVRVY